jgi:hypothetical protein
MKPRKERDTWTKRYADWTRKHGSTLQCSPALGVLAFIAVSGVVIYIYRKVILTTLITAVAAAVSVALLTGAVVLTISTVRWYRRRAKAMAADPSGAVALATVTDDADTAAISREADWLAGAGSELVFDKDGNLHAKSAK